MGRIKGPLCLLCRSGSIHKKERSGASRFRSLIICGECPCTDPFLNPFVLQPLGFFRPQVSPSHR
ncbi:hypothetical protein KNP414_00340 [Paenibacillus mucilaginosus KNP414]|uniref:Uncharacterized protein n=1 Tax=Paenibacillus mucilaginosus (strain KNP414) TaxID=1036673 RepID=F8FNC8_PAEMK|nr:hypothetical protein KNP414_00340 [Paenibacillus mucilaginosus KNP414]